MANTIINSAEALHIEVQTPQYKPLWGFKLKEGGRIIHTALAENDSTESFDLVIRKDDYNSEFSNSELEVTELSVANQDFLVVWSCETPWVRVINLNSREAFDILEEDGDQTVLEAKIEELLNEED